MEQKSYGEQIHAKLSDRMDSALENIRKQGNSSFNTFDSALIVVSAIIDAIGEDAIVVAMPGKQGLRITITPRQSAVEGLQRLRSSARRDALKR
jgi:hypothetical protein